MQIKAYANCRERYLAKVRTQEAGSVDALRRHDDKTKVRILPNEGNRMNEGFDSVGVDLNTVIRQEGIQTVTLAVDVGQFLTQPRLGRDTQALRLLPFSEDRDQRRGAGLTR